VIPSLTDAELLILGLLAEQPRHGYELERVIDERGMRRWTALGFSSIYYVLDKLTRRDLIEVVGAGPSGRSRVTYAITGAGEDLWRTASLEALAEVTPLHARVLLGLAGGPGLPEAEVIRKLDERVVALAVQLAEVRAARAEQEPLPAMVSAIFDYSEAMLLTDTRWAQAVITSMKDDAIMEKYDVKKQHRELYAPGRKDFTLVDVPEQQFLAIDGHGDPNTSPSYRHALETLYPIAYALKFDSKSAGRDFVVAPLEGLWWAEDNTAFTAGDKDAWNWTMMISQPEWVTAQMLERAVSKASSTKDLPALPALHLLSLTEGRAVQILHIGSYDDEGPTLERLHHEYLPANGLDFNGRHHEIYLSDARRTPAAKLKTILRQPVKPAAAG
jgi:DNA-binding PadR family transcriptional regulator